MTDVMIDLETEGTGPQATVVAVAAVLFELSTGEVIDKFYAKIDPEDARKYGVSDQSTIDWWAKQDPAARAEAFGGVIPSKVIAQAFRQFCLQAPYKPLRPWGNGATFDITIAEYWLGQHGFAAPWEFWDIRDVRTLVDVGSRSIGHHADTKNFVGMKHKALDDCLHQIRYCYETYRALQRKTVL